MRVLELNPFGVGTREYQILKFLQKRGMLTVFELSRLSGLQRSNLYDYLRSLEILSLVKKGKVNGRSFWNLETEEKLREFKKRMDEEFEEFMEGIATSNEKNLGKTCAFCSRGAIFEKDQILLCEKCLDSILYVSSKIKKGTDVKVRVECVECPKKDKR